MSSLHTISKSPDSRLLEQCLALCSDKDAILFIEDGVYHGVLAETLAKIPAAIAVYALREDLQARGLQERIDARAQTASMKKFVELCGDYDKVISWF